MFINKKTLYILLPFTCFIIGYVVSNILIGNKNYTTPNLVGLSLYEAIKLTSPHQINIRILSEKENANIPAGIILSQRPSPDRIIKTHQPIFVTITKSLPDIKAPLLLQQSYESVEKICRDMKLKIKSYEFEYAAPYRSCIAQLPLANTIIHDKKMIIYCAKDKQDLYIMPDFVNQSLTDVCDCLKGYTDKISVFKNAQKIIEPYHQEAKIITQKPLAGSLISMSPILNVQLEII